ncbi:hypothetical protein ZOSMA_151G00090 [Zostera marina]|uniref:Uncharacterized protein n=1 Tax=Zostera marina TaxID=29655 RepID=A0A0K9PVX9_ZOSMR|nr:hypothetical protein ZOSMA_151G00090 [Zostera marina]
MGFAKLFVFLFILVNLVSLQQGRVMTKPMEVSDPPPMSKWCCDPLFGPCYELKTDCTNDCGDKCKDTMDIALYFNKI